MDTLSFKSDGSDYNSSAMTVPVLRSVSRLFKTQWEPLPTDGHQVQSFKRLISLQRGVTTWSSSSSLAPSFNQTPICPHSHHHPRCSTSSQPACTAQDDGLSASITLLQTPRKETCESDKKTSQHPSCPPYRPHRTNVACTVYLLL